MLVACRLAGLSALEAHYVGVNRPARCGPSDIAAASPRTAPDTQTLAGTYWSVTNEIEQHDQEPTRDAQMPTACFVVSIGLPGRTIVQSAQPSGRDEPLIADVAPCDPGQIRQGNIGRSGCVSSAHRRG